MKLEKLKTCDGCEGQCCCYVAIEIDTPETLKDFEDIKWYVSHEHVLVYIEEDGTWNIQFDTPCKYLDKENKCTNYEKRPKICREYEHDECPFHNEYKEKYTFREIADVEKYVEEVFKKGKHVIPKEEE